MVLSEDELIKHALPRGLVPDLFQILCVHWCLLGRSGVTEETGYLLSRSNLRHTFPLIMIASGWIGKVFIPP